MRTEGLSSSLGLNAGDADDADDVLGRAAAGQVVHRGGQALRNGTVRLCLGQALYQLVTDVASVQIGEDENVRFAGDRGVRCLGGAD